MTSALPPLVQAFSGAVGSASANAIVYPLDLIATRLQTTSSRNFQGMKGILLTFRHILRTEGWSGLYDGLGTDTAATFLSNFLYFYFYTLLRTVLVRRKTRISPPQPVKGKAVPVLLGVSEELGIGFIAGLASRAISAPLNVVTVYLQTEAEDEVEEDDLNAEYVSVEGTGRYQRSLGVITAVRKIYDGEGLQGFWRGFTTSIPLSLNPAITLFFFQIYRKVTSHYSLSHDFHKQTQSQKLATPNARSAFVGAAFSNVVAIALLYPLILAKTRLQVHRQNGNADANMFTIWREALRREGFSGIYRGLDAQILKGFVAQGVTMTVKQRIEVLIVALYLNVVRRRV